MLKAAANSDRACWLHRWIACSPVSSAGMPQLPARTSSMAAGWRPIMSFTARSAARRLQAHVVARPPRYPPGTERFGERAALFLGVEDRNDPIEADLLHDASAER